MGAPTLNRQETPTPQPRYPYSSFFVQHALTTLCGVEKAYCTAMLIVCQMFGFFEGQVGEYIQAIKLAQKQMFSRHPVDKLNGI
jgi:hypothetical protein